jgi:hypothetical protein
VFRICELILPNVAVDLFHLITETAAASTASKVSDYAWDGWGYQEPTIHPVDDQGELMS